MAHVGIVGGGIFGCTAAIHAAWAGHRVELYEQSEGLLSGATAGNQSRLHEGYHYPRSPATVAECRQGNSSFRAEYGEAVINDSRSLYAIATNGSKVSAEEYLRFCQNHDLPFTVASAGELLNPDAVDLVIEAEEGRIDVERLKLAVGRKLYEAGVTVHINTAFTPVMGFDFDKVIIATYASSNSVVSGLPAYQQCRMDQFQYEVCEKPVVQMPPSFNNAGVVVMDGEFCCVDPLGETGWHVLGHVKHAIWHRNIGLVAEVPYPLVQYMDRGVCFAPARTRITDFIEAGVEFIPELEHAEYIGSMFTVRAVLPNKDATDERPTLVESLDKDGKYVRVFAGKIGTAVEAAKQAVGLIG